MASSDQKINYQIRPSKSVERKMLCELIRQILIIQGVDDLRYIGMGAKYFADFMLFHNEFGVQDMISIEAEREYSDRYEFNKPLKCIEMFFGTTNEVLPQIDDFDKKMNLVWLDFDGLFSEGMLYDVETLVKRMEIGSVFFLSCNYSFKGQNQTDKMKSFKESVGDFFDESIEQSMYTNKKIPIIVCRLINKQIDKTLEVRNRGCMESWIEYMQLMFVTYKDGAPMLTIGGILVDKELKEKIVSSNIYHKLDYCNGNEQIFNIDIPPLTNKEIQFVLQKIPITDEEYETNKEHFFGIKLDEIRKLEKIYRYYPFYSEGRLSI